MSDDPMTRRIAQTSEAHGLGWIDNGSDHARCYCGHTPRLGESWHWHVADAVIRELGSFINENDALGYTPAPEPCCDEVRECDYPSVIRRPTRSVSAEELIAVLGAHVYGDRGPFTDHPHRFSVCTRAAEDLTTRYRVLRIGGGDE